MMLTLLSIRHSHAFSCADGAPLRFTPLIDAAAAFAYAHAAMLITPLPILSCLAAAAIFRCHDAISSHFLAAYFLYYCFRLILIIC